MTAGLIPTAYDQQPQDVTTEVAAKAAAWDLEGTAELAVDVEADAMHAFRARLCFVQVGTDSHIYLFDTLQPGVTAEVLKGLCEDPKRIKYFHAAGGDLQYLAEANVRVRGLFDTHRAATLLGWAKVGLADLVRERIGVELKKEHQQSDFAIRPLPAAMREYISDDVRYLCAIGRQVREQCVKADILEEVELDCERLAEEAAARPDVGADYKPKIPKENLSAAQQKLALAIAQGVHRKRLQWAEAANVPMGRMLSNAALAELAVRAPTDPKVLARVPNIRGSFARQYGDEVTAIIRELVEAQRAGTMVDPEAGDRGARDPKRKKREDALKTWRSLKATSRKVTPSVVLSNSLMEELSRTPPNSVEDLAAMRWFGPKRVEYYGVELVEMLKKI